MAKRAGKHPVGRALRALLAGFALFLCAEIGATDALSAIVRTVAYTPAENTIAVIYPDLGEPYRTVFTQIIAGIESRARIVEYALGPNAGIEELKNRLRQQNIKVVIALGRQGMGVAASLDRDIGVVMGGVITAPDNGIRDLPLHSLSPDPALLFELLKKLLPATRRVFAVYNPKQNAWLIRQAKMSARSLGLELVTYEAQDLHSAVQGYQDFFNNADSRQDALWLLQDSTTVEESSALPLVLQESWNRNLAVFSSNFGHVRRGVLFSLYPDNGKMGGHLADMALRFLASGDYGEHGVILLREVLTAINLRTAKHLDINTSRQQDFDVAFPDE
ncbi:ABC transporter substrate binding protein [Methylomonas sp. UP202]|uniref:ABC transporter substrate binding protein n=1 Tax=Methylomonas sp. UP202 TaxID=3040943 RepID=UPI00247834CF|nr:ABC transporter substrate binding protein [Methylomonas sp. UP202]WGS88237.1 ABC transporter substrate binding protein [Methylomonas sp. UP202]